MSTCSGWHRQHSSSADILDKLWTSVIVEPLSRDELSQVKSVLVVRPSGRGTVHSRPHKIFLHFHDLWILLNKIREGVVLSFLNILHKTH